MAPSDAELMGDVGLAAGSGEAAGQAASSGRASAGFGGAAPSPAEPSTGGASRDAEAGAGTAAGFGPDAPPPIPQTGLELWLKADRGISEGEPGKVAVWADFSPHEMDARQSLASAQPAVTQGMDGLPAMVEFDGVDDQLVLKPGFSDFRAGLSAFVIASASVDQNCPSLLHLSNQPEEQDIELGRFHGAVHYEVADEDVWGPDNTFDLQQRLLLGVVHAPEGSAELRLNGIFMASRSFSSMPEVALRANNFIGRSLYSDCENFHGKIGEVILYSRALDSAERLSVEAYLQSKWSYEPLVKTKPGPGKIEAAK